MNRDRLRAMERVLRRPSTARAEWELDRLARQPRRQPGTEQVTGLGLEHVDGASFASAYRAIFVDRIYDLPPTVARPRIVDAGANVGVAVARWSTSHPEAVVHAIEPDPHLADVLRRNVQRLPGSPRITVTEAALWRDEGSISFVSSHDDAGHVVADGPADGRSIEVPTTPLGPVLQDMGHVDLLKVDIEGAETVVLEAAADQLHRVDRIFVEYHSMADGDQVLPELLAVLRDAGMRLHVHGEHTSRRPFLEVVEDQGMDLRLNLFAQRAQSGS